MATRMQQRRGTAAQWVSINNGDGPILEIGEIGFESDTGKFKIGNGTSPWSSLDYFLDESEINNITDDYVLSSTLAQTNGVATLDGSGKLTSAQIPTSLASTTYVDNAVSGLVDSAPGLLNTLNELAAAVNDDPTFFTTVATNLSNHEADTTNIHGIVDTTELATKTFAAELLTNATKTNIIITGDKNGLTITAENGVGDSTTDNLSEGTTNKYFTDERAQDAIGNNLGTGLSYNDSTGAISVTENTYDQYGSASTAQTNAQTYADTAVSNHSSDTTSVHGIADTSLLVTTSGAQTISDKTLTSPTINGASIGGSLIPSANALYDLGSSTNKFKDLYLSGSTLYLDAATIGLHSGNVQLSHSGNTTTIPIGGGAHTVATESYVTNAISNLIDSAPSALNTLNELAAALNDDASFSTTITNSLGLKAPLESPTFTGTVTLPSGTSGANLINIPNSALTNSSITINGSAVSLGGSATIDALPSQTSNSGKYLTTDGTSASWVTIQTGYVPIPTTSVSSNINLSSNNRYFVDTSAVRTLTLPASPTAGDEIQIFDIIGSAETNNIIIDSNGAKVNGTVQNLEIDIAYDAVSIIYTGSGYGWKVI